MSRFTVSFLTICLCLTLAASPGAGSAAASGDAFCVVLVSDESGSMDGNDPGFLRNTGLFL